LCSITLLAAIKFTVAADEKVLTLLVLRNWECKSQQWEGKHHLVLALLLTLPSEPPATSWDEKTTGGH